MFPYIYFLINIIDNALLTFEELKYILEIYSDTTHIVNKIIDVIKRIKQGIPNQIEIVIPLNNLIIIIINIIKLIINVNILNNNDNLSGKSENAIIHW